MKDRRFTLILLLLSLIGTVVSSGCKSSKDAAETSAVAATPTAVDVTTTRAIIKPIPTYIEATGNLASDAQTDVAPAIGGKIVEVNFDIGSYVQQGSVLVRLDSRDAQIRLEQARSQAEQQRRAVGQAEANVGQAIANLRQTQARLGVSDGETFQIKDFSQVKSITAQLNLAEIEYQRAVRLLASGDVSRSFHDQKRALRDQLLGQLDEARSNAAVAIKAINTAQASVEAARATVSSAKAAVQTAEAQISQAQKSLNDNVVLAPISGYVSEKSADVGEYISPNVPNSKIATIVRTSTLRARIDVPEQDIGKISTGNGISLQTSAYPDRRFAGTVVRMSPGLNTTARTLNVEAEVQNVDGLLKPGQFVTVRITQAKPEPAVMIPTAAIKTNGDISSVFVIDEGIGRERFVQLGLLEGDLIQVKQGVVEGDLIAVSNVGNLTDGVIVRQ